MSPVDGETIVVGIDGSECSHQALTWALDEAKRSGRSLLLVHAWHWTADAISSPLSLAGVPDSRKGGHSLLASASARAKRYGVSARTHLAEGSPAAALTELSEDAAMLVVGAHGHRGLNRVLVGSVSQGCLRHARCPVVVVGSNLSSRKDASGPEELAAADVPRSGL